MKKALMILTVCASFLFAQDGALKFVQEKDSQLQALLKQQMKSDTPEVQAELKTLVGEIFDFQELGTRALGEEAIKANAEKLPDFQVAFANLLEKRFLQSVRGRLADSTTFKAPKAKKDYVKVKSYVFSGEKKTKVTYKLLEKEGSYKVFDLITGSSSTLKTYREMFAKLLEKKSFQEIIDLLVKKTNETE